MVRQGKDVNTALFSAQQMCVRAGKRWSLRNGLQGASRRVTKGKGSFRGEVFKTEKKKRQLQRNYDRSPEGKEQNVEEGTGRGPALDGVLGRASLRRRVSPKG